MIKNPISQHKIIAQIINLGFSFHFHQLLQWRKRERGEKIIKISHSWTSIDRQKKKQRKIGNTQRTISAHRKAKRNRN